MLYTYIYNYSKEILIKLLKVLGVGRKIMKKSKTENVQKIKFQ